MVNTKGELVMALLTKSDILKNDDLKSEVVNVPEWGGDVMICSMRGEKRDAFETAMLDKKTDNYRARYLAASIVDENKQLMFTESDVKALGQKSAAALDRVFSKAWALNNASKDAVEDLAKN